MSEHPSNAPGRQPRARIQDVAKAAGVSAATVSRVLNGSAGVDVEKALRVQQAVDALGYQPSAVARNLRRQQTMVVGMLIADIRNAFFAEVVRGVEDHLTPLGYLLVLCDSDEDPGREANHLNLVLAERMAGAIVCPASIDVTDVTPLLGNRIPTVTVDRLPARGTCDWVLSDNTGGARDATVHLLEEGYRRIGCISGPHETTTGRERIAGWQQAHQARGLTEPHDLVRFSTFSKSGGYEAAADLLARDPRPDALFVANGPMTLGALAAIAAAGLRVPDDVGLVGFDDPPWAAALQPPLTTVSQHGYAMGRRAAEFLTRRIAAPSADLQYAVLPTELVVRRSSRPPRAATPADVS